MTLYVPVAFLACRGAWGRGYQSFLQLGFEIKVRTELLSQRIKTAFYLSKCTFILIVIRHGDFLYLFRGN